MYKFEKLEVWQKALDYVDLCYGLAEKLPAREDFNLKSQIRRAATSVCLNIAEGSMGQTDPEQCRFLGLAIRSLVETIGCQRLIERRKYIGEPQVLAEADRQGQMLIRMLQSMRKAISSPETVRENGATYSAGEEVEGH